MFVIYANETLHTATVLGHKISVKFVHGRNRLKSISKHHHFDILVFYTYFNKTMNSNVFTIDEVTQQS